MSSVFRMEPLLPEDRKRQLDDACVDLIYRASGLAARMRGKVQAITGYEERQARNVLKALLSKGLLVSQSPRSPVRLGFPAHVVGRWLPRLHP